MIRYYFKNSVINLSYLEWQQGDKSLLLLHGLADHALVWSSLGDYLSPNYHIVAPDLRGHGESFKPEKGYRFSDYIEDLEALMDDLGWQETHILGHSWGAKLAAIWATLHPERFKSLILVDPFFINTLPEWFKFTFPILYKVLPFLKITRSFSSYEEAKILARQLKQYQGWTELQEKVFQGAIELRKDGTWGSKFVTQARDEIFAEVMRVAGLKEPLDIPSLLILPQQGLNRTQWQIKPYKTYLKNLQIQSVPGNHWAFLVQPEAFNQTVEKFLTSQIE